MPQIPSGDGDVIYTICAIKKEKDSTGFCYVPIVSLNQDLKSYTIAASIDLLGVQLKNQQAISDLRATNCPIVVAPIPATKFKKLAAEVESNVTVSVNTYINACRDYDRVVGILGEGLKEKNLKYHLYSILMDNRPPCVLTPDYDVIKADAIDVIATMAEAAALSEDGADCMFTKAIELIRYEDEDDDQDNLNDIFN